MNGIAHTGFQANEVLSGKNHRVWRVLQAAVLLVGLLIFGALVFYPETGLHAFWNVLIPVAPALFVVSVGFWRNVCPLGTVSLLPRHLGISKSRRLSLKWQGRLHFGGVLLLFLVVPLRHIVLDTNGMATALTLAVTAAAAFTAGCFFEWKSGWCSGLCPVHPVEKMYAGKVKFTTPNAHCTQCANCVIPCPDSTPDMSPAKIMKRKSHHVSSSLLIGGLPGFVWGWFHVPDCRAGAAWTDCVVAFGLPYLCLGVSLSLFLLLRKYLDEKYQPLIVSICGAAAISFYYWYRLPALVGYGLFPGDGMLVDLTPVLPVWVLLFVQLSVAGFFVWWLVIRQPAPSVWSRRPPFAKR